MSSSFLCLLCALHRLIFFILNPTLFLLFPFFLSFFLSLFGIWYLLPVTYSREALSNLIPSSFRDPLLSLVLCWSVQTSDEKHTVAKTHKISFQLNNLLSRVSSGKTLIHYQLFILLRSSPSQILCFSFLFR